MTIAGAMRYTHHSNRAVCGRVWLTRIRTREDIVMDLRYRCDGQKEDFQGLLSDRPAGYF